jgi:SAM-dependent methyltransferase
MTEPLIAYSLSNFREIILGCLERAGARTIVEIGSEYGEFTEELTEHARRVGGRLITIDPAPQPAALEFAERHKEAAHFTFLKKTSLEAIEALGEVDVYIVDGDHNYYTVRKELEAIALHQERHGRPSLIFEHDVGWPWARRDLYYAPERIPEAYRQPHSHQGGVSFDHAELVPGGFGDANSFAIAVREGGKQNGVRTAIEDFLVEHPEFRFEFVPGFFGLGIVYSREAPWADRVAELLQPFADNILLARMERNRSRLVSRVLEFEHQGDAVRGGYLQGSHMLEVFSAADSTNFERLFRTRVAASVRDQEELTVQSANQFSLPGFCVLCNRTSRFATDRLFAGADAAGRWMPAWRERQICSCGFNCRQRSSYHVLTHLPGLTRQANVYCPDAGPLFRPIRNAFPAAVAVEAVRGSAGTSAAGTGAPSARIGFADASLDCIYTQNALEHTPHVRRTVREMARCLRPFGWLLMTSTLHFDKAASVARATEDDAGNIEHHLPPVRHPDPNGGPDVLLCHDFGWDLLSMLRESGFASAEVVVFTAPHYGYAGVQYVILAGRGQGRVPDPAAEHVAGGSG